MHKLTINILFVLGLFTVEALECVQVCKLKSQIWNVITDGSNTIEFDYIYHIPGWPGYCWSLEKNNHDEVSAQGSKLDLISETRLCLSRLCKFNRAGYKVPRAIRNENIYSLSILCCRGFRMVTYLDNPSCIRSANFKEVHLLGAQQTSDRSIEVLMEYDDLGWHPRRNSVDYSSKPLQDADGELVENSDTKIAVQTKFIVSIPAILFCICLSLTLIWIAKYCKIRRYWASSESLK